jgi:hypothetical protein
MKPFILLLFACLVLIACNNQQKEATASEAKEEHAGVTVPNLSMPASYSSSFTTGNPEYAAMIVQGSWKDWEDKKLDNMRSWVADSVLCMHSDGTITMGVDSLTALWKRDRDSYTEVKDSINAVVPLYSTDKKENWVLVWATAYGTKANGVKDTAGIMETWRINKDGKADWLLQYDRRTRKK